MRTVHAKHLAIAIAKHAITNYGSCLVFEIRPCDDDGHRSDDGPKSAIITSVKCRR